MLLKKIRDIYQESRETYGSPRIYRELRDQGVVVGKNRVARLMSQNGIRVHPRRRFAITTDSNHHHPIFPNVLDRRFDVNAPNKVWASDITYIPTHEGWLYLAVVIDLFSRQVIGWSMAEHMRSSLTLSALRMALSQRDVSEGLIHHSDRGVQYACHEYQGELRTRGIISSMSRKGDCWDNAVVESFFRTMKVDLIYRRNYKDRATARQEIFEYVEVFYNRKRRHSHLGYLSPVRYEELVLAA